MAKLPNKKTPVACIRRALNESVHDFASRVEIDVWTIKKVESGRRPVNLALAKKIALAVNIPAEAIMKKHWTPAEQEECWPLREANNGRFHDVDPFCVLPEIIALYYALATNGTNPLFALGAIRNEVYPTLRRFGVTPEIYETAREQVAETLFPKKYGAPWPLRAVIATLEGLPSRVRAERKASETELAVPSGSSRVPSDEWIRTHLKVKAVSQSRSRTQGRAFHRAGVEHSKAAPR